LHDPTVIFLKKMIKGSKLKKLIRPMVDYLRC